MAGIKSNEVYGMQSPGGFAFGVQGWHWGEPKPTGITFFLDGSAKVADQHGRPIRGALIDTREVMFAQGPPIQDDTTDSRKGLATHMEVVMALEAERIEWRRIPFVGWPQLPYDILKTIPNLPFTPFEELRKIRNEKLRKDALKIRREMDAILNADMPKDDE